MTIRTILAAVLCAGFISRAAWADVSEDISLTLWAGAGGAVGTGAVNTVQVLARNGGEETYEGALTAAFPEQGKHEFVAVHSLELPPGSVKRVNLYVPYYGFEPEVRVRFETPGESAVEVRETVRGIASSTGVVGAVGRLPRGLPPNRQTNPDRQLYAQLFLQPEQIPDRAVGLELYDAIFLTPPLRQPLTSAQARALRDWVLRGGRLFVDASERTAAFEQESLRAWLPYVPTSTEQGRLAALGEEVVYTRGRHTAGEILLGSDDTPLIVRQHFGLGVVTVFAVNPDDPAFLGWNENEAFWYSAFAGVIPLQDDRSIVDAMTDVVQNTETEAARQLTQQVSGETDASVRLGLVLLMTALYAFVAGPGDYWLVRRLGRPQLTWITFPLIVIAFTLAAYLGARWWIGGEFSSRYERTTTYVADAGVALESHLTGIFAPRPETYKIETPNDSYTRYLGAYFNLEDPVRYFQDRGLLQHDVPIWTHRAYLTESTKDTEAPVTYTVERRGLEEVVHITNTSDIAWQVQQLRIGSAREGLGRRTVEPGMDLELPLPTFGRQFRDTSIPNYAIDTEAGRRSLLDAPRLRREGNAVALGVSGYAVLTLTAMDEIADVVRVNENVARGEHTVHILQPVDYEGLNAFIRGENAAIFPALETGNP